MKKQLLRLFFSGALIISTVFVFDIISEDNPFMAHAQTTKVKKKRVGLIRNIYRKGKIIGKEVWTGSKWVGVKTSQGLAVIAKITKNTGKKTWKGIKKSSRKTKKAVY